jgi:Trypsin-like serine proteases, typically periplasmic, contain C-terminal PDZ domain
MRTIAILALVSLATSGALAKKEITQAAVQPRELSLVRVNVTGQGFDYFRPWQKRAPFSKRALGAVLSQGRVLVTADLVANQNYVELERAESGEKSAASVEVVDYEANLALLQPQDKKFLSGLAPLELANDTIVGDRLAALQLEQTGALVVTDGLLTAVQVTRYPADVAQFLTYRLSIALQYRDNSYTVPLVKNNKLAGLLLRYDPRSQLMDVIPTPIIAHFLKDASKPNYPGFPSIGFSYFPTRDPQLRKYSGENGNGGGVYITGVEPGTAAQKAGLQVGDIVKSIGTSELDQNGNYVDSLYKKMDFTNLLTLRQYCGDKVPLKVLRQGKPLELSLNLEHRAAADYVIPPYPQDEAPKYYILGGLIFQELTRQYLREWGANWLKDAPQRFVYLDRYQWELFPEGHQRVVILSQILPVNSTIGYDDGYLTVSKVNGKEIRSLNDLAEAVNQPVNGFYKIETVEDPKQFELDAAQVRADEPNLRENYGIPALQRLN